MTIQEEALKRLQEHSSAGFFAACGCMRCELDRKIAAGGEHVDGQVAKGRDFVEHLDL